MIVASRKTKLKQFIPACQIFREVSLRIAGQPGCAVTGFTPEDSLKKYNDACVYQMTLDSVSTLVVVGKYPEACGTLFRSYQFYKSGNAHLYIPKPLVAERFIEERNNLYLTVAALDQAIAGKNLAKTLFFLQLAKNQQASADQIRKQQETTGAMIATVENENRPVPDQALQLLNSPDRFWKFLQSAYNQHVSELNQR
jgi:hypothetical protein